MKSSKILIVEDDKGIAKNLFLLLSGEDYDAVIAPSQKAAMDALETDRFDLILLDISLPDGSGYAICTAAKRMDAAPVIFLTASDDEISVVTGLDLGAEDYIIKPFRPMELLSRIKNILRRSGKAEAVFEIGNIKIDSVRGTVLKNNAEVFLTALEYRLLLVFVNNNGIVLSREKLLREIWDIAGEFVNDNTLTVYIKRLREKIEDDPQNPDIIKTVRGLGYKLGE
ncbi:MAG: response regulator transcription factor [Oscillospiraceae bacterium]|nr:response regulator transcription factor [Oscillospiraceae bacterium]MDD3833292.1 response regulator transcription factor [Oscillospiraceae bacterium]